MRFDKVGRNLYAAVRLRAYLALRVRRSRESYAPDTMDASHAAGGIWRLQAALIAVMPTDAARQSGYDRLRYFWRYVAVYTCTEHTGRCARSRAGDGRSQSLAAHYAVPRT